MHKHWYASILLATVQITNASAQVIADFEDGNIDQWLVEADGVPSLDTVNGLPDNCLRITDQAVGVINQLVAPLAFTGDWSAATTSDSISFDILNHLSNGSYLAFADGMVVLSGPGGTASTAAIFTPVQDTWLHEAYALDTSFWTMESGTWEGLLDDIQYVRIRTEFVSGGEYTLIDNVTLTFEPFIEPVQGTICSTWDTIGNLDGWSFQNVGSIQVSMTQGNPPGSVRMGDGSGALTYAVAAPKFRGDWSGLDGVASMTFDLYLQTSSSNYYPKEYLVKISGPDGSAMFMTNDSITALTVNQWRGYEIPIVAGSWELQSGTWAGLLNFVSEIRLELEFIDGTGETTFLDNFCLNAPITTALGPIKGTGEPVAYPNPFSGTITMQCASEGPHHLRILDMTGRTVHEQRVQNTMGIDLSRLPAGAYSALVWNDLKRIQHTTLIKQ